MKRHPSLRDLSVEHHHALVQAHRLQRAADADDQTRRTVEQEFFRFWHEHTNPHFREEDEALLPFFARYGDVDQEPIRKMQREHILIRRDVGLLRAMSTHGAGALRSLGEQLEAHVRLEERVVFPLIESTLPAEALAALADALAAWRNER
jgi:hemerythrin-like domain-containing protein